jgi:hypothetical protein
METKAFWQDLSSIVGPATQNSGRRIMAFGEEEVLSRFGTHGSTEESKKAHRIIKALFTDLALEMDYLLPDGRDKSLVFTHLEDAAMRSNRAVSHHNPLVKD